MDITHVLFASTFLIWCLNFVESDFVTTKRLRWYQPYWYYFNTCWGYTVTVLYFAGYAFFTDRIWLFYLGQITIAYQIIILLFYWIPYFFIKRIVFTNALHLFLSSATHGGTLPFIIYMQVTSPIYKYRHECNANMWTVTATLICIKLTYFAWNYHYERTHNKRLYDIATWKDMSSIYLSTSTIAAAILFCQINHFI